MKKIILFFIICLLSFSSFITKGYAIESKVFKDFILAKKELSQTYKGKKYIRQIDQILNKYGDNKTVLEKLDKKLVLLKGKLNGNSEKSKLLRNIVLYLYGKTKISLEKIDNNISIDSTIDVNTINNNSSNTNDNLLDTLKVVSNADYGLGISNLQTSDMNYYNYDVHYISFTFAFNNDIYANVSYVNIYDTFAFKIKNNTSGKVINIPGYFTAFPGTIHNIPLPFDFFDDKNGIHNITIEPYSSKIASYENFYNKKLYTNFNINVSGIGTGVSKKISVGETNNDCSTTIGSNTYTLSECGGITIDMVKGEGDKKFSFTINSDNIYKASKFYITGNAQSEGMVFDGFQRDSIGYDYNGGGIKTDKKLTYNLIIKDSYVKEGEYNTVIHIGIMEGDQYQYKNRLNLPLKVKVTQKKFKKVSLDNLPAKCQAQVNDDIVYVEPCNFDIEHIKGTGNKTVKFTVKNTKEGVLQTYTVHGQPNDTSDYLKFTGVPEKSFLGGYFNGFIRSNAPSENEKYFIDDLLEKGTYNTNIYIWTYILEGNTYMPHKIIQIPIKLTVK